MRKLSAGFTLAELLVVISVIALLAAVIYPNFSKSSALARDTNRKADLRELQAAIELYKQKNGRYPEGCNAPLAWSGSLDTSRPCADGTGEYIRGLAPAFMPVLPTDPKLNGSGSGYFYVTDVDGSSYKIIAAKTVESETVTYTHPFRSCNATNSNTGICDKVYPANTKPNECQENNLVFKTTYGLWGGYPEEGWVCPHQRCEDKVEDVVCKIP